MLLADEQEPVAAIPPAAEPVVAEVAPDGATVEHRDILVVAEHGERAEGDDPPLPLELGVGLGEGAGLLLRGGAVALLVHLRDRLLGLDLAIEVLHEHDAVPGRLVHIHARGVLLERTPVEDDGDAAVPGELALQHLLTGERAVVDRDEVLTIAELRRLGGLVAHDGFRDLATLGLVRLEGTEVVVRSPDLDHLLGEQLEDLEGDSERRQEGTLGTSHDPPHERGVLLTRHHVRA